MRPNIKAKSFSKLLKEVRAEIVFTSVWAHNMAGEWASGRRRQFMLCVLYIISYSGQQSFGLAIGFLNSDSLTKVSPPLPIPSST